MLISKIVNRIIYEIRSSTFKIRIRIFGVLLKYSTLFRNSQQTHVCLFALLICIKKIASLVSCTVHYFIYECVRTCMYFAIGMPIYILHYCFIERINFSVHKLKTAFSKHMMNLESLSLHFRNCIIFNWSIWMYYIKIIWTVDTFRKEKLKCNFLLLPFNPLLRKLQ